MDKIWTVPMLVEEILDLPDDMSASVYSQHKYRNAIELLKAFGVFHATRISGKKSFKTAISNFAKGYFIRNLYDDERAQQVLNGLSGLYHQNEILCIRRWKNGRSRSILAVVFQDVIQLKRYLKPLKQKKMLGEWTENFRQELDVLDKNLDDILVKIIGEISISEQILMTKYKYKKTTLELIIDAL
jgi:hypothetical protein